MNFSIVILYLSIKISYACYCYKCHGSFTYKTFDELIKMENEGRNCWWLGSGDYKTDYKDCRSTSCTTVVKLNMHSNSLNENHGFGDTMIYKGIITRDCILSTEYDVHENMKKNKNTRYQIYGIYSCSTNYCNFGKSIGQVFKNKNILRPVCRTCSITIIVVDNKLEAGQPNNKCIRKKIHKTKNELTCGGFCYQFVQYGFNKIHVHRGCKTLAIENRIMLIRDKLHGYTNNGFKSMICEAYGTPCNNDVLVIANNFFPLITESSGTSSSCMVCTSIVKSGDDKDACKKGDYTSVTTSKCDTYCYSSIKIYSNVTMILIHTDRGCYGGSSKSFKSTIKCDTCDNFKEMQGRVPRAKPYKIYQDKRYSYENCKLFCSNLDTCEMFRIVNGVCLFYDDQTNNKYSTKGESVSVRDHMTSCETQCVLNCKFDDYPCNNHTGEDQINVYSKLQNMKIWNSHADQSKEKEETTREIGESTESEYNDIKKNKDDYDYRLQDGEDVNGELEDSNYANYEDLIDQDENFDNSKSSPKKNPSKGSNTMILMIIIGVLVVVVGYTLSGKVEENKNTINNRKDRDSNAYENSTSKLETSFVSSA